MKESKIKAIVQLRKLDPLHYTFKVLDKIFELNDGHSNVIFQRNKDNYNLPYWIEDKRKEWSIHKMLVRGIKNEDIPTLKLLGKSDKWIGEQLGVSRTIVRKRHKRLKKVIHS